MTPAPAPAPAPVSPLTIADQLITLARDADRAGYPAAASRMVRLALRVWEERPAAGTA